MKMKILGVLTAGAALLVGQAQAQNFIQNGDFSLPGTGKIQTGWDTVPNWFSGGTATDSGVEQPGANMPTWAGYSDNANAAAGIWANQLSTYVDNGSDNLYLSFWARNSYTFENFSTWAEADNTFHWVIWAGDPTGVLTQGYLDLGTGNGGLGANYYIAIDHSLIDAAAGFQIGISLYNTSGGIVTSQMTGPDPINGLTSASGASWDDFSNVVLTNVPEPGTLALLTLGGLSTLVAFRRRSV